MIPEKRLAKRISHELLSGNPAWKIIVNKNNWLCPFCGEIGAEKLRLDDDLEGRIAQHLRAGCPGFHDVDAETLDDDTIEKRRAMLTLQREVRRALARDPAWQIADADGTWLCPFCAKATDIPIDEQVATGKAEIAATERQVRRVVRHLFACKVYADGRGEAQPLERLLEARTHETQVRRAERVLESLKTDARWRFRDMERRWLCPFCAEPTAIPFDREREPTLAMADDVGRHLDACLAAKQLAGEPRNERYLKDRVIAVNKNRVLEKLTRKLSTHPIWQVTDADDAWYCPYCAAATGIKLPDPGVYGVSEHTITEVWLHLSSCEVYTGRHPELRSKGVILQAVALADRWNRLRREVRRALLGDGRFSVHDRVGSWLCPYCRKVQKRISVRTEPGLLDKTIEQVVGHLGDQCSHYVEGQEPATLIEELRAQIEPPAPARPSAAEPLAEGFAAEGDVEWVQRIGEEVAALKTQVGISQELQQSLEDARSRQLRLMPKLPEIDGFEVGVVYEPSGRVSGDFYDFFRATDRGIGITVGDVAGHGIEAALLVGLAKKLIQVHARGRGSPGQALLHANTDIYPDLDARTFVTVFLGILDPDARTLRFARAGHNPLILFNPARQPALRVLDSKGMALGMDAGPIFATSIEEVEVRLQPGDLLVQYTDGVTEAMNHDGEEFGLERLHGVIEKYGREEAEYVLYQVERAMRDFREGARQKDDVTLVAIKVS